MPLTTLPENPTRLQRLQADAAAITWMYVVPQPGGITSWEEYHRRIAPVHEEIEVELQRLAPRRAGDMPVPTMPLRLKGAA